MVRREQDNSVAIEVSDVWKKFRLQHQKASSLKEFVLKFGRISYEEFWALKDVSFTVKKGEAIGIIGENGSGKSTMLKLLTRILRPNKGKINVNGRASALLELGAGFHPELTGRENIYLNASIMGLSRREVDQKFDEIVSFAELERFVDTPVKDYSSGMYIRLGFAIAVNMNPDILLVDEVLAVGDEYFQRKCFDKFYEFKKEEKTVVLVSHALDIVRDFCDRAIWLDNGEAKLVGNPADVISGYMDEINRREEKARFEKEGKGFERWGSHEVEITDVEFLDSSGEQRQVFVTGEPLTVKLSYLAHRKIDDPVFGVAILTKGGVYCYGTNTKVDRVNTGTLTGAGCVYLTYPALNLLPGVYVLDVAIYDEKCVHPYDFHSRAYSFSIRGSREDQGTFFVDHKWKMERG